MKENQTNNCLNNIIIFLNNIDKLNYEIYNQYKLNLLDTFACLIEGIKNHRSYGVCVGGVRAHFGHGGLRNKFKLYIAQSPTSLKLKINGKKTD